MGVFQIRLEDKIVGTTKGSGDPIVTWHLRIVSLHRGWKFVEL